MTDTMEVDADSSDEQTTTAVQDEYDASDSSDHSDTQIDDEDDSTDLANAGWVDSISKILKTKKPKGKKTLVLSKAKKLTDARKPKIETAGFEVATEDGGVKDVKLEVKEEKEPTGPVRRKKKDIPKLRVKPNILNKDHERTLSKIATKGVVQLFNAVRLQQKDISTKLKEAGPLEVKKERVLKNIDKRVFLDVLMGDKSLSESASEKVKKETNTEVNKPTWSVLRDDFMMGAKLKDWDKQLEEEEESEKELEMEENFESD